MVVAGTEEGACAGRRVEWDAVLGQTVYGALFGASLAAVGLLLF